MQANGLRHRNVNDILEFEDGTAAICTQPEEK
jgi:hypothetical protein